MNLPDKSSFQLKTIPISTLSRSQRKVLYTLSFGTKGHMHWSLKYIKPNAVVHIISVKGKIIGWLGYPHWYYPWVSIFVHSKYRKMGIATQLLQVAIRQSQKTGIPVELRGTAKRFFATKLGLDELTHPRARVIFDPLVHKPKL